MPVRTLPDGTKVHVTFHGSESVEIDGKTFRVGDRIDNARKVVAITENKVKLADTTGSGVKYEKSGKWYKKNSQILVAIKRRGEGEQK